MVPRPTNPIFTGRKDILEALRQDLCTTKTKGLKISVICGMGGSGKSEICLKFVEDNIDRFATYGSRIWQLANQS